MIASCFISIAIADLRHVRNAQPSYRFVFAFSVKEIMVGAMPDLPVGTGGDAALETAFRRLLDELWPILAGGLEASLNMLIRAIFKTDQVGRFRGSRLPRAESRDIEYRTERGW
ncbi:hypothetical protein [Mesorhizobium tianshanense]|nr:hypothetical protein [Mesorhizobium tianshanense]